LDIISLYMVLLLPALYVAHSESVA
jgi:hypothetical protein